MLTATLYAPPASKLMAWELTFFPNPVVHNPWPAAASDSPALENAEDSLVNGTWRNVPGFRLPSMFSQAFIPNKMQMVTCFGPHVVYCLLLTAAGPLPRLHSATGRRQELQRPLPHQDKQEKRRCAAAAALMAFDVLRSVEFFRASS